MYNASAARRNKRDPTEGEIGHRQCMTQTNQQQTCLYSPIQQAPTTRPHDGHLASPITCVFQLATEFVDAVCTGRVAPGGIGSEVALTATEKLLSAMLPPRVFRVAGPGGTLRDRQTVCATDSAIDMDIRALDLSSPSDISICFDADGLLYSSGLDTTLSL